MYENAVNHALKYLGFKARTQKEMETKLQSYGYTTEIIDKVLIMLKRYSYVDDEKYTQSYIKDSKNLKRYGNVRIRYELEKRGVSSNIIDIYLDDEGDAENAIYHLNKKIGDNTELDKKTRDKLYAYLLRKGFSHSCVQSTLKNY